MSSFAKFQRLFLGRFSPATSLIAFGVSLFIFPFAMQLAIFSGSFRRALVSIALAFIFHYAVRLRVEDGLRLEICPGSASFSGSSSVFMAEELEEPETIVIGLATVSAWGLGEGK